MDDDELVASIVAGDLAELARALDEYGTPVHSLCRSLLPPGEAAEVVVDTFAIARVRLDGLSDPAMAGEWLQVVARGECQRRLIAAGLTLPAYAAEPQEVPVPADLHGRILAVCTDDTALGRAHRASLAHEAGPFGRDGFPKPFSARKAAAYRRPALVRSRRGLRLIAAAIAGSVVLGAIAAMILPGGSHPAGTAAGRLGRQDLPGGAVSSASPAGTTGQRPGDPVRGGSRRAGRAPRVRGMPGMPGMPGVPPGQAVSPVVAVEPMPAQSSPVVVPSVSSSPAPAPLPTPSAQPSTPPAAGTLMLSTNELHLMSVNGTADTKSIILTAAGGPVGNFAIRVSGHAGGLTVSPQSGSLAAGQQATILVTASGTASFTAYLTFAPGNQVVVVQVQAKAHNPPGQD